eukprot:1158223-Pelagomonas_calceolata.AAC.4
MLENGDARVALAMGARVRCHNRGVVLKWHSAQRWGGAEIGVECQKYGVLLKWHRDGMVMVERWLMVTAKGDGARVMVLLVAVQRGWCKGDSAACGCAKVVAQG